MNKGTKEGNLEEISLTIELNKKCKKDYWSILKLDPDKHFAVHVTEMKDGMINGEKIWCKSDIYIVEGKLNNLDLISKGYYLNENDIVNGDFIPVVGSGISVKMADSKKYQILKISPSTFLKIFKSNFIAAGASIYCTKPEEFCKNLNILSGWNVNEKEFLSYFGEKLKSIIPTITSPTCKKYLNKIKKYSNYEISRMIYSDSNISDFIFYGKGNFDEPFTASWLFEKNVLKRNYIIPYTVTTGSGRSKGDYTIVIKPK